MLATFAKLRSHLPTQFTALILSLVLTSTSYADKLSAYSIDYRSEYSVGWFSFDIDATKTLTQRSEHLWNPTFDAEASIASLKETSDFIYRDGMITPVNYTYRASGLIDEPDRTLHFVASTETVEDQEKKRTHTDQWQPGIQDNLTYIQSASLALAEGKTEFSFPVFEKTKTKWFRYQVLGEEDIKVKAGTFRAIKVKQLRKDKNREILVWFAKTDGYPLIRLRDKKKGKLRYQIQATKIRPLPTGNTP